MYNKEKAYANVQLKLTSLQMIWLQHSGFLDKIARMHYVNYYYNEDQVILTSGDKSYCQRAISEINQLLYEEFVMEIHKFNNYQEITPFINIFHTQQFLDIRTQNRGFWIYTFSSLNKQQQLMRETKGYIAQLPELPYYFLIMWFPIQYIKQIKQDLFQMTGYEFDKIKTSQSTRIINPLSALEALSIFLILNIQKISESLDATFILQQDHDQFSIQIQSTSNIQEAFDVVDAHINKRKFWPFFNVNQQFISELQIQINDVIRTAAGIKLFTKEEVVKEASYLDKMFNIDISGVIIRSSRSNMIYVYSDQQKQEEITDKLIVLVRKLNSLQYDKQPQSTPKQIIQQPNNYYYNQFQYSYQPNQNNTSSQIYNYQEKIQDYYDNRQSPSQNQLQYDYDNIEVYKQQTSRYYHKAYQHKQKFIYTPKFIESPNLDQPTIPLQQTGEFFSPQKSEVLPLKNYKKNNKNTQFEANKQYEQIKQQNFFIETPPIKYEYVHKRDPEESKLSQLIQIEEVSNYIECQILKIEILSYQLIYQTNKSCQKKINFQDFQTSFQKYAHSNYTPYLKSIQYMQNYLEIDLIVDSDSQYQYIKQLYHQYFNQTKYYVTIASETPQNFVKTFENQFDVGVMRTNTDYHGYITHEQFEELTKDENGYNIVIIIKNYTIKDEEVILSKLEGFEIHYQFLMNSSIIDTSKLNNQVGVLLLSNEQVDYLLKNYPQLDCKIIKKFRQLMKIDFSFAQIENDKSFSEAQIELNQLNQKYIEDYIKTQSKDAKDKFVMKKLKSNINYLQYKIYVMDNIKAFYTSLLQDNYKLNLITLNEYKQDKPIYYEASINIGTEKFNYELLNNLFIKQYPLQKKISILDIPKYNFLTVIIRSEYVNAQTTEELSYKNMLIRGYIEIQ